MAQPFAFRIPPAACRMPHPGRMNNGIFVVCELTGAVRERVHAIQRQFDPRMAGEVPPHITLVGSSGAGPIALDTPAERISDMLRSIASETPPITTRFERPHQFIQTNIVVLPLDPHGPLRTLHERIVASGLTFMRARFMYSPHCTMSFYQTLTAEQRRRLLAMRVEDPVMIDQLQFYRTVNPQPGRKILELKLGG